MDLNVICRCWKRLESYKKGRWCKQLLWFKKALMRSLHERNANSPTALRISKLKSHAKHSFKKM